MKIQVLEAAELDLASAATFYEYQEPGLGAYFVDALAADIDSLLIHAGVHPEVFGFHRALSGRFPYAIDYLFDEDAVKIYAVLDCRRSPTTTKKRLTRP